MDRSRNRSKGKKIKPTFFVYYKNPCSTIYLLLEALEEAKKGNL